MTLHATQELRLPVAASLALLLLSGMSPGQEYRRTVVHLDGAPGEAVEVLGVPVWLHDEESRVEGLGALKILPAEAHRDIRVALRDIPVHSPKRVAFHLKHLGSAPARYWLWVEDADSRGSEGAASQEILAEPGWNEIAVDLQALQTRDGSRRLQFPETIRRFQVGRRKQAGDPGFIVDGIAVEGEPASPRDLAAAKAQLEIRDAGQRNQGLPRRLAILDPRDRIQLGRWILRNGDDARTRRIVFDSIAAIHDPAAAELVLDAANRHQGTGRLLWLQALALMPTAGAREICEGMAADPRTGAPERCVLLAGMVRRGRTPPGSIENACPPEGPWQTRAALVLALNEAGTPEAVDRLIRILRNPGSRRVEDDTVAALIRWTGRDLGTDADAWQRWRDANRDLPAALAGLPGERRAYATFYGLALGGGRTTFVIDTSGSMREPVGGGAAESHIQRSRHLEGKTIQTRLDLVKEELVFALGSLPEQAVVQIIHYGDGATALNKRPEPLHPSVRDQLEKRVRVLGAAGGTNIHDALVLAIFEERKPDRLDIGRGPDTVILLTDGYPSSGPLTHGPTLKDAVLEWNLGRMIRFHTVNAGDRGQPWLRQLAEATGGQAIDLTSRNPR